MLPVYHVNLLISSITVARLDRFTHIISFYVTTDNTATSPLILTTDLSLFSIKLICVLILKII